MLHTRSCLPLLQLFVVQVWIIAVMRTGDKVRGDKGNLAMFNTLCDTPPQKALGHLILYWYVIIINQLILITQLRGRRLEGVLSNWLLQVTV